MILGMLRVKNEARWIEHCIASILPVCDHVLVMDDHSEDQTAFLCLSLPKVNVLESPFFGLDEVRDKNWLMEKAEPYRPSWILHIDGDEEVQAGGDEIIRSIVYAKNAADAYRFQILYLWNRPDQIRTDGIYASFRRTRLFRFTPGARFGSTGIGGNFHCGNAPQPRSVSECNGKILHLGYMSAEDRIRKYHWYNSHTPVPPEEDGYRHMVIGDLFPHDSRFRHGGPLTLQSLGASA